MRWIAYTPDGLEWFYTRKEAENHVVEWFNEELLDCGEGHPDSGFVAMQVSELQEVVDDSQEGEEAAERMGVDYVISGYEMVEVKE